MKVAGGVGFLVLMIASRLLAGAVSPDERFASTPAGATPPTCAATAPSPIASGFTGNFMLDERSATPPALLFLSLTQTGTTVSGYGIIVQAVSRGTTTSGTFPVHGTTDGASLTLTLGQNSPTVLTGRQIPCGLELTTAGSSGQIELWTFVPVAPTQFNQIVAAWQRQLATAYQRQLAAQTTATAHALARQATQEAHAAAIQATASAQAAAIQATAAAIQVTNEAQVAAMQATAAAEQATANARATARQATVDAYATASQATQDAQAQQQTAVQNANAAIAAILGKLANDAQTLVPPPDFNDVRTAYAHDWAQMQTDDQTMRTDAAVQPLTCVQLASVQSDLATLQVDSNSISVDDNELQVAMNEVDMSNSNVAATRKDIQALQAALRTLQTVSAANSTGTPVPQFTQSEVDQAVKSAQQKIDAWTGAVATMQAQAKDYDQKAAALLKQAGTFVAGLSCSD